ncbi:MAG: bifunctional nuclease family protein [Candidatus Aenigmatarchaeota archaeon]
MKYKWKKHSSQYKILYILLLLVIVFLTTYILWPRKVERILQPILLPELSTTGFSKVENIEINIFGNVAAVNLRTDCYELVATVEASQAESIQRGVGKVYVARPNAHDIVVDAFNSLGIEVVMVKITELKENAFYSKLILRQENTVLSLDARPSDAIAIATRTNSSIYINSTLLKEVGRKIC